uniref:Uncharacterized protein n=1 Tax=Heterorhabditis bacteriophora TaxID=37862 RepID=A0A1I7X1E2_HETBA
MSQYISARNLACDVDNYGLGKLRWAGVISAILKKSTQLSAQFQPKMTRGMDITGNCVSIPLADDVLLHPYRSYQYCFVSPMITPAFFIALFFTSAEVIFDPCKEYYEYVCRNLHPEKTVELEPYNFLFDFYQGPQLTRLVEVQRTLVELSKIDQINIVEEQLMNIELKRNPELLYEEKKHLVTLLHNSSVWFGFVDYTDVLYYELAKSAYDKEFKRLSSLTSRQVYLK